MKGKIRELRIEDLNEMVFSTFAIVLQRFYAKRIYNLDLILTLYNLVYVPVNGKKYYNIKLDSIKASNILRREPRGNIDRVICECSKSEKVKNTIEENFKTQIIPKLKKDSLEIMIEYYTNIIDRADMDIDKKELKACATTNRIETFLSKLFLYTLSVDNVAKKTDKPNLSLLNDEKFPNIYKTVEFEIPNDINQEMNQEYIKALLKTYEEDSNTEISTIADLEKNKNYKDDLNDQRRYFYSAVAVEEAVRDIGNDDTYFSCFVDEIYDCIIDKYRNKAYPNGFARMKEVLFSAANANTSACWLCKNTEWIAASQKKGACHILVNYNDGRLDGWVYKK